MREIEIRDIQDEPAMLYNPEGTLIGAVETELQLNDVLIQIRSQSRRGYYLTFRDRRLDIGEDGRVKQVPSGFFNTASEQLKSILGF